MTDLVTDRLTDHVTDIVTDFVTDLVTDRVTDRVRARRGVLGKVACAHLGRVAHQRELRCDQGRAVAGNLGRFQRKIFSKFVPASFRWTDYRSRPGTKFSICENVSVLGQDAGVHLGRVAHKRVLRRDQGKEGPSKLSERVATIHFKERATMHFKDRK